MTLAFRQWRKPGPAGLNCTALSVKTKLNQNKLLNLQPQGNKLQSEFNEMRKKGYVPWSNGKKTQAKLRTYSSTSVIWLMNKYSYELILYSESKTYSSKLCSPIYEQITSVSFSDSKTYSEISMRTLFRNKWFIWTCPSPALDRRYCLNQSKGCFINKLVNLLKPIYRFFTCLLYMIL